MKSTVANRKRLLPCLRIVCRNGSVYRVSSYPYPIKMSGQTYSPGFEFTGFESGTTFAPAAVDLKNYIGVNGVTEAMLMAGVFDNAKGYHFFTDWSNPVEDEEAIAQTRFGKVRLEDSAYTVEQMTLIDLTNQTVGYTYSNQCQHEFGGQEPYGCGVNAVALRVTGTIEAVNPQTFFYDSALTGVANHYVWGKMWMTSGPNVGIPPKTVRGSEDQYWDIYDPFPYEVQVGNTYMLEPGCLKFLGACVAHNNVINRLGFDHVPGETILKTIGDK